MVTLISQTYYLSGFDVTIVTMFGSLSLSIPLFSLFVTLEGQPSTSILLSVHEQRLHRLLSLMSVVKVIELVPVCECVCVGLCLYVVHHCNGTELCFAPTTQ